MVRVHYKGMTGLVDVTGFDFDARWKDADHLEIQWHNDTPPEPDQADQARVIEWQLYNANQEYQRTRHTTKPVLIRVRPTFPFWLSMDENGRRYQFTEPFSMTRLLTSLFNQQHKG